MSKWTLVKEDPESESIMVSGDERSNGSTEMSSPVIKVYGSTGAEASLEVRALETTKMGDRNSPYGAWVTGKKSEAKGVLEMEAPVSNTIGTKFGWRVETESETGVAVGTESTAADAVVTESTVEATTVVVGLATEVDGGVKVVGASPMSVLNG